MDGVRMGLLSFRPTYVNFSFLLSGELSRRGQSPPCAHSANGSFEYARPCHTLRKAAGTLPQCSVTVLPTFQRDSCGGQGTDSATLGEQSQAARRAAGMGRPWENRDQRAHLELGAVIFLFGTVLGNDERSAELTS